MIKIKPTISSIWNIPIHNQQVLSNLLIITSNIYTLTLYGVLYHRTLFGVQNHITLFGTLYVITYLAHFFIEP